MTPHKLSFRPLFLFFLPLALVAFLASCSSSTADELDSRFVPITANVLSNQRITRVVEDSVGYIWVGTFRGLNRLNGEMEVRQYFHKESDSTTISDDVVLGLFPDHEGNLWVGTNNAVNLYTEYDDFRTIPCPDDDVQGFSEFAQNSQGRIFARAMDYVYYYDTQKDSLQSAFFCPSTMNLSGTLMHIDSSDRMWLGSPGKVRLFDTYSCHQIDSIELSLPAAEVFSIMPDQQLWFSDHTRIGILDMNTRAQLPLPEPIGQMIARVHPMILNHIALPQGDVLLCTDQGLYYYNNVSATVIHQSEVAFPLELPRSIVHDVCIDRAGNLWYMLGDAGIQISRSRRGIFSQWNMASSALAGQSVAAMVQDAQGRIWMQTRRQELFMYDTRQEEVRQVDIRSFLGSSYGRQDYFCLFVDREGDIWFNTDNNNLFHARWDGKSLHLVRKYAVERPLCMGQDQQGNLWVGTFGTQYLFIPKGSEGAQRYWIKGGRFTFISCIQPLHNGQLVALVQNKGMYYLDPETGQATPSPLTQALIAPALLQGSMFRPTCLYEDAEGGLWIGTVGNGLVHYNPTTHQARSIQGLACQNICAIEANPNGQLWISTEYGLSCYDLKKEVVTNYYMTEGLGGNQFNDRASCQESDGTLYFGGSHGLTTFNPNGYSTLRPFPLVFEELRVFNRPVLPTEGGTIDRALTYQPTIRLNHRQQGFSISFSALDFCHTSHLNYEYHLEGVDKVWVEAGTNHSAYYAQLKPGHYTFSVRLVSRDHQDVLSEVSIPVVISPAPWLTWWAWLCYVALALAIILFLARIYYLNRLERLRAAQARREKEQEQRINQMNMNFFANVSHEFRTPLTVISGPIGQLSRNPQMPSEAQRLLQVVDRSVKRMLQLVNQMMDFHRLEDDTLSLEVRYQDVIPLIQQQVNFFELSAREKEITFRTQGLDDYLLTWMDADKVEKMLNNLLGNAMKYTPRGGRVQLELDVVSRDEVARLFTLSEADTDTQYLKLCIRDNGPGIPVEAREKVFDRYYQLRHQQEGHTNWGTGIGLYYVRRLTLMHHGHIRTLDNPDGQGSCFCIVLPMSEGSYTLEERTQPDVSQQVRFPLQEAISTVATSQATADEDSTKPHILCVDDDVEIIQYLRLLLEGQYRVTCRFDANSALQTLQQHEVDLVISDVLMPGTDGYQLCRQIQDDSQLCHIPVILVTAKNTVQDQVEGLHSGAMAYVTKPFDPDYLQALIQSQLEARERSRRQITESTHTSQLDDETISDQDKQFLSDLYRLMEEELGNPDMDIARMTELLHISRSKLYYKIKGLTGENPAVFFRQYKLNRAAQLILEGKYNVSEISLLTGFSTLSHFSTSFKRQFGVTPSEYKSN